MNGDYERGKRDGLHLAAELARGWDYENSLAHSVCGDIADAIEALAPIEYGACAEDLETLIYPCKFCRKSIDDCGTHLHPKKCCQKCKGIKNHKP